jgi:hypothetical protein
MTHQNCTLSPVRGQYNGQGFIVRGDHNRPLVTLTYETKARAEEARAMMVKVLEGASVGQSPH